MLAKREFHFGEKFLKVKCIYEYLTWNQEDLLKVIIEHLDLHCVLFSWKQRVSLKKRSIMNISESWVISVWAFQHFCNILTFKYWLQNGNIHEFILKDCLIICSSLFISHLSNLEPITHSVGSTVSHLPDKNVDRLYSELRTVKGFSNSWKTCFNFLAHFSFSFITKYMLNDSFFSMLLYILNNLFHGHHNRVHYTLAYTCCF